MMQHLADALRTAAAAPPTTSIDLDQLIATEQRAARRRRTAAMAGAALAVVALTAAVAVGPSLGRGAASGQVPGEGSSASVPSDVKPVQTAPALTPEQRRQADQLVGAVTVALGPVISAHGGWSFTTFEFGWEATTGSTDTGAPLSGYLGTSLLNGPDGAWTKLAVLVQRAPMPTDTTCVTGPHPDLDCSVETEADGTQVWRSEGDGGGQRFRQAEVYRPEGTHVAVRETAISGRPICFTLDELVVLVHSPLLTVTS